MQDLDKINFAVFIPTKHMDLKTYAQWIIHKKQVYKISMNTDDFIGLLSEIGILSYTPNILKREIKAQLEKSVRSMMEHVIKEVNKPKFPHRQPVEA